VPPLRAALVLPFVLLLVGCGIAKEEEAATREVKRADLRRLVVPKKEIGTMVTGLKVDRADTGRYDNKKAAEDSIDPKDTARKLARLGRITGYELTYTADRPSPLGVVNVSQGVELFRTRKAASRYLKKFAGDYVRLRGRTIEGIKLARVEEFDVDVGDEATGLSITAAVPAARARVFGTMVVFRRGRVFGGALVLLRRQLMIAGDVERIVEGIDEHLQNVVAGESPPNV
jgi:hypothetical protein